MSFSLEEALAEKRRRRYKGKDDPQSQLDGFTAWCSDNVTIKHPLGKRKFLLRPEQEMVALSFIENNSTLCLKARQIGFTTVTMNFCLWRALFFEDWDTIILNRREADAVYNLEMASLAYNALAPEMKRILPQRIDNNLSKMTFDNGSKIESHPSNNNPARGRTARLMVLDEWAFMPNPEDAWASVEPATDIGGQIIALSTANGWGNLFHKMWVGAVGGDNQFAPIFFPWSAVPERDAAWYARKKASMPGWQLAQEYPTSPEEAFIQSGNPVFDTEGLKSLPIESPIQRGRLWSKYDSTKAREYRHEADGPLRIWEIPQLRTPYVVGVDVAEGLEWGDYSSAHVINCKTGVVAAHWHGHIDVDLWGVEAAALAWWYNTALLGIEANNHGLTTLLAARSTNYPRIYMRRRYGSRKEHQTEALGWYTSAQTRPMMIDELAASLRSGELVLHDEATRQELMTFTRDDKGKMSGSPFDDRVMSLAIANQMRKHAYGVEAEAADPDAPWTMNWALKQLDDIDRQSKKRQPLGQFNVR